MRKNKWKNELVNPLKDKGRTMKLEYFLSNNYVLSVLMIVLDLFVILGGTYQMCIRDRWRDVQSRDPRYQSNRGS